MSAGHYIRTEKTRRLQSRKAKGKKKTLQHCINISESKKGKMSGENNPNYGKKHPGLNAGDNNPAKNPGVRDKISKTKKEQWKNPSSVYHTDEYWVKKKLGEKIKPNKLELNFEKLLNKLQPNEWKYVGDFSFIIAGKCPDFVNINEKRLIIELYGDYWHKGQDPQERIDLFSKYGYKTLVIWEKELKDMKDVEDKIMRFIE